MAIVTSVRDYCALLAKSKLLPAEEVESVYRQWKEETQAADDALDPFCKHLVSRRLVTEWQAGILRKGRSDGFFIADYKILDRLGRGQMGGVYRAVHGSGQMVALKVLPASRAKDPSTLGRFQRESRLLIQLDHPNVVRAFRQGDSGGINYIAMEYLEGDTLDDVLNRRKRLPWAEAVRLVHQALNGLQHLFEKRMVHRDIKPANMMLTPAPGRHETTLECTLKILDIGLGRELFDEETPEGKIDTQLTVEGSVLGTPDYLAPEQAKDARNADIRADIYSAGCVLFHCLCGRPPFPDTNIMAQMLKHATEKPPLLSSIVADVPAGLQPVLDTMLAKFPDERYPTPAVAADALKPFLGNGGVAPAAAQLVPGFKEWLESESRLEMTKPLPPPNKPGTAPSPALVATSGSREGTALRSGKHFPVARPAASKPPRAPAVEEVDVELVPDPQFGPMPLPDVPQIVAPTSERPLWEFDRRDWIMLASGATGVLAAVGIGYGLARLMRKKPEPSDLEE
jgi:serine/threonine protein kinase